MQIIDFGNDKLYYSSLI